jgi:hypothetical protein
MLKKAGFWGVVPGRGLRRKAKVKVNVMSDPAAKQRQMINLDEFERRLGRPTASAKNGEDPLAELARLVGETEDRFKTVFQGRPGASTPPRSEPRFGADRLSPRVEAPGAALRGPRLGGDFAAIEAGLRGSLRGSISPDFHAAPASEPEFESEDWLDAPYVAPAHAQSEPPRSRVPLYATAAVIILGMAGIGGTFALKRHSVAPREIAMIDAAAGPTKIPASDTGDAMPSQDASVLDKSPQTPPVAVINHSEEPVDVGAQQTAGSQPASTSQMQVASAEGSGAAVVPVPTPPPLDVQPQAFGLAGMIEPKKVKTVVVRPDGTIVPDGAPQQDAPAVSPAAPPPVALDNSAPADTAAAVSPPKSEDSATTPPPEDSPPPAHKTKHSAQAKPVRVADTDAGTTATDATPAAGGAFAVQLAAPASEADARKSMAKLQKEYGDDLAGHRLKYRQATVANKSVYRVRVVGLSHEEATALCQKVEAKSGSCFVAKE